MTLQPGARPVPGYSDYKLIRKLGAGAFGEVWHAHGPGGIDVALKFIRLEAHLLALELRSLEVMKSIRHPNLVSLFGAWHKDNWLILAMELCDRSLQERLTEALDQNLPGIPLPELLNYMSDAANGLDALNAKQVQHRDVKPANLLLLDSGVKVADFGLAKALEHTIATNSGGGTIAYLAPECFKGSLTQQSDQYSLAVTYYHLRTGKMLFKGDQAQVMYAHLEVEPDLSALPQGEAVVLRRALSKEPGKRWHKCKVFVKELMAAAHARDAAEFYCKRGISSIFKDRGKANYDINKNRDIAIEYLDEAIRLDPSYFDAYIIIALFCSAKGDYDKIIKYMNQAILLVPNHAAGFLCQRGNAWREKKEYDSAIKDLTEAIRLDPKKAVFYYDRGKAWSEKEDHNNAIKDFDEAILLNPKYVEAYRERACALYENGDIDKAMKDLDEAILLDPQFAETFSCRAIVWEFTRDYHQAVRDHAEAIRLDPSSASANASFAWLLATCPQENIRDPERAIQLATNACKLTDWKSGTDLSTLAVAYSETGQFNEAVQYQTKALAFCRWSDRDVFLQRLELYKQKKPFRQRM